MLAILFHDFIPNIYVDWAGGIAAIIVLLGLIYKFIQWRKVTPPSFFKEMRNHLGWGVIISTFIKELINRVALERDIIVKNRLRLFAHFTMFWGFLGLMVTTTIAFIINPTGEFEPITDPNRILGNVSGVLLLIGSTIAVGRLILLPKFRKEQTFGGVFFLILLWVTAITGFTTEYYSIVVHDIGVAATDPLVVMLNMNYAIHLTALTLVLVTAPFTGFLHAITTPSLRLMERLNESLVQKTKVKDYKEVAQEDQIKALYKQKRVSS